MEWIKILHIVWLSYTILISVYTLHLMVLKFNSDIPLHGPKLPEKETESNTWEWNKVEDKLPDEMQHVLIYHPPGIDDVIESIEENIPINPVGVFYAHGKFLFLDDGGITQFHPTHWCSLPRPPA